MMSRSTDRWMTQDQEKYDTVLVKKDDGSEERLTAAAFAAMPLHERVQLVSKGKASFFKDGERISAVEALRK